MTLKRKLYERLYFIYYAIKDFGKEIVNLISEFKKPRMWFAILCGTFFIAAYTRNRKLMVWAIPFIVLVYFIRHKRENFWKGELFEKDLRRSIDSNIVKDHYRHYTKQCHFSHKEPIGMEEWKKAEIKRLDEKCKNDRDARH